MGTPPSPPPPVPAWVHSELDRLSTEGLLRVIQPGDRPRPGEILRQGQPLADFTSNDYLGLSAHPSVLGASIRATSAAGCGSGGSRLVTGDSRWQRDLEAAVADWLGDEAAVLFPSGYQANVGTLTALLRPGDQVFSDAENHASIVDGCRLSRATVFRYAHGDAVALSRLLAEAPAAERRVVVTDSLFSMDGSAAPLQHIAELCQRSSAVLVIDEAHALGAVGPRGTGIAGLTVVTPSLRVGTFSKALGSQGAFVSGAEPWIRLLHNRARALIYSTALPPPTLAASLAAVEIVRAEEGEGLRAVLRESVDRLHGRLLSAGLRPTGAGSPLLSISFEDPRAASVAQERLTGEGLLAWAFRPPTVPPGSSRLRISLCALHPRETVDRLADALPRVLRGLPLGGARPQERHA